MEERNLKKYGIKNNSKDKVNNPPEAASKQTQSEPQDWFYMSPVELSVGEIADYLRDSGYDEVDLWEDMGVLQVEIPQNASIDFEILATPFTDPSDKAFVKNRNIKQIYTVTLEKGTFEGLKEVMCKILDKWEGLFCADTTDFKPAYDKDTLK